MVSQAQLNPKIQEAINAALENDWEKALRLNQELLEKYPDDIETLNRLARSFGETGKINEAKRLYKKVLGLDPYNQIAERNLRKLSSIKKADIKNGQSTSTIKGDFFLEEPGKTITTLLEDTAMPSVLATLRTGDKAVLSAHRNNLVVTVNNGKRIGKIEKTLAGKIIANLRIGSKFEAFIKSVSLKSEASKKENSQATLFIREIHRSSKASSAPFPTTAAAFTPFVREEALNLLSNQAPVPTEADDAIEEIEIAALPSIKQDQSLEELAEKEQEEIDNSEEE